MFLRRSFLVLFSACFFCACSQSPAPEIPEETVAPVAEVPPPPKQLPPPGEPGPFMIQIQELFPNQVFGSAATADYFAIAVQADARDVTFCPATQLPVCFKGAAYITPRMNPNEPKLVPLYEADTQSGSRVDDLAASIDRFAFALNDGVYAGDDRRSTLVIADQNGNVERSIPLDPQNQVIVQTALAASDTEFTACYIARPADTAAVTSRIHCEKIDAAHGSRATFVDWPLPVAARTIDIAALKDDLLIAWTAGGKLYASFSDDPQNVMELGTASASRPVLAAGHEQFMVAWQGEDAQTRVTRVVRGEAPSAALLLNGVTHRSIGGLVPTVPGFLIAFRYDNAQQLAVIEPDLSAWYLLEGSSTWRQLSGYASIEIQDAHTGRMIWQTAESLIGENK